MLDALMMEKLNYFWCRLFIVFRLYLSPFLDSKNFMQNESILGGMCLWCVVVFVVVVFFSVHSIVIKLYDCMMLADARSLCIVFHSIHWVSNCVCVCERVDCNGEY